MSEEKKFQLKYYQRKAGVGDYDGNDPFVEHVETGDVAGFGQKIVVEQRTDRELNGWPESCRLVH